MAKAAGHALQLQAQPDRASMGLHDGKICIQLIDNNIFFFGYVDICKTCTKI